ncbi:hypothetical protein [Chondromyces apiculatus]|uniref:Uncharacterized protein n=1 Tax=Chondromyces apiculatus DSM 436 TaxID=1192034 RepID=A0A017T440_9BACT|nr:hypothetical protein [Chondromyces apiculatus]EYF03346.1 Hypothetical protein CAP_5678 [Chondromyces apiculatus DSM 436]
MHRAVVALSLLLTGCSLFVDLEALDSASAGSGGATATSGSGGGGAGVTGPGGSGEAGGGGSGEAGNGGTGGGEAPLTQFVDDFERADGDALGNGWTEKNSEAFRITGGTVIKDATMMSVFRNNLASRPASEDQRDVEVSIEFRPTTDAFQYPQLFLRGQRLSLDTSNNFHAYVLYVGYQMTGAMLGYQDGEGDVQDIASLAGTYDFESGAVYRLTLSAVGEVPQLTASVERRNGNDWVMIDSVSGMDPRALPLTGPGAIGFSAHIGGGCVYDNFSWRALPATP